MSLESKLVWTRFKKSVEIEFHTVPEFPKEKPTPPKYAYLDELKLRVQKIDWKFLKWEWPSSILTFPYIQLLFQNPFTGHLSQTFKTNDNDAHKIGGTFKVSETYQPYIY